MDYKADLLERVELVLGYEDDPEMSKEIGLNPGEVAVSFCLDNIVEFLEDFISDNLKCKNIPLLPTLDTVDERVLDIVKLAEKVGINVYPETVGVEIDVYDEAEGEDETTFKLTPYYNVRALALFDMLISDAEYEPDTHYSVGVFDQSETSDTLIEWLSKELDIQIDPSMKGTEIVAKVLSKIYDTEVSFVGFMEAEDVDSDEAAEAAENGECIMLLCMEFKMAKAAFEAK